MAYGVRLENPPENLPARDAFSGDVAAPSDFTPLHGLILRGPWVPAATLALSRVARRNYGGHVATNDVLSMWDLIQVPRIHARWRPAEMVQLESIPQATPHHLEGEPMPAHAQVRADPQCGVGLRILARRAPAPVPIDGHAPKETEQMRITARNL